MKIGNLKLGKIDLSIFVLLIFGFLFTRLFHLTIIPVFCDEAIYIRWAQVMRAVESLRFLPLSDGKQPFFMWLVIPFLKVIKDPLVAGRMVSVLAGLGTMFGITVLSFLLFRKKEISFFASLLYLISPFTLFFDRMALADGLLSFFFVWTLVILIMLVKDIRLDLAMIAGIFTGLAWLTKSPAMFILLLLPTTIILFNFGKKLSKNLIKLLLLWVLVYIFGFTIYNILRLGPEFHMIALRNKDYVFSFSEVLSHPLNPFLGNFKSEISWFWILLTPSVFVLGILGILGMLKKNLKAGFLLLIWVLFPLLVQAAIAKVFTARYVLFTVPVLLVFAAFAVEKFFSETKSKVLVVVGLVVVLFFPIYQSTLLIFNPQLAWLPENERSGYLEMWTAGFGIKESANYLKEIAKTQKVLVGTEGYFATLPDGLQIYLEKVPNINVIGVGYPIKEISPKLIDGLKDNRVFLLVNDTRFLMTDKNRLKLIDSYPKAVQPQTNFRENLLFFEVIK